MESKTDYGFIFIISFAIAYFLIGILKLCGYGYIFDEKIILGCSICSVAFAVTSILETFVTGYKKGEKSVISKINDKHELSNNAHEKIHENYIKNINLLHKLKSILLVIIIPTFFFITVANFIEENPTLSDGLSLISFALIIFDIALKMYFEKIITEFNYWAQKMKRGE